MSENDLKYTIKDISLSDIVFPKDELRTRVFFEDLDELARSIRTVGLLNPLTVRVSGEKYELIAGFRRLKAAEIANLAVVPCRIVVSDDTRADLQKLHENMFREAVNPIDEGAFFKRLLIKNNWRLVDLAVQVHKSPGYVSKRIQLTDADPLIVNALQDNQINLSIADELSKVDSPETRQRLLHYAINSGATVETVRMWRMQYETDQMPAPAPLQEENEPLRLEGQADHSNAFAFGTAPAPVSKIVEHVVQHRPCFGCLAKVDTRNIFEIFLCTNCKQSIETALRPATSDEEPPDQTNAVQKGV